MKKFVFDTKSILVVENPDGVYHVGSTIVTQYCSIIDQLFCPKCNPSCKCKNVFYNQERCFDCGTSLKPRFPTLHPYKHLN